jgi:hypothetical protein
MIAALERELHEENKTRLTDQPRLQRAAIAHDLILMVLQKPPCPGMSRCEAVVFWRKPDGHWQCSQGGTALSGLEQLVNDYDAAIAQIQEEWEPSTDPHTLLQSLSKVRRFWRASLNLRDALQEATLAISGKQGRLRLQRLCDRASDIARSSETLRTKGVNALKIYFAKQREVRANAHRELVRSGRRLNVATGILLLLSGLAILGGISLQHGIEASTLCMLGLTLAGGILLSIAISRLVFGRFRKHTAEGNRG